MTDFEQIRKYSLQDGDVLALPAGTPDEQVKQFVETLRQVKSSARCLVVVGDLCLLDETAMNAAGWYRK
ncbi:hypothetical protein [Pseudomonas saudiphocaensis]|uniref:Uncharacterized protein n=1 Tax=Pseudomonas saudiphocaensis TaxID=1499686 RepID=A0A078LQL5_9PSED|nr:hypothetical protein [Pseudomonas saudiphocaensis]CDZ93585.1 hypothetical protein BN1079_00877 [Pseudomonas saudiphocaensis]